MRIRPDFWICCTLVLTLLACTPAEQAADPATEQTTNPADQNDPYRLATNVEPVAQQLKLNIDPDAARYSGTTSLTIDVAQATSELRLHAKDMQIETLGLTKNGKIKDVSYRLGEHGLLIIDSVSMLPAGTYELTIAFNNDFNTDGVGINQTEQEDRHYVFSQFEAIDARQAFPCFDEPGFKYPWQLSITVPTGIMAITNTPEVSVTEQGDFTTVVFAKTPPLPSYLIAVAVGPFETVPIDGMSIPGRVIVPHGKSQLAAAAVETTPPLLAFLEDYFGEPYPFKKLDLIATNQAFSGAMEHPGAITYSDFFLLLDEHASARQKSTLIRITAHELAHQWFGNLVTMQWWDDLWLNESFADWMGDKTTAAVYPEGTSELRELRTVFQIMDVDARPTTKPIRHDFKSTDDFGDGIFLSYYKGKSVLSMFEKAVGADTFQEGVIRYLRKYSRGNARASDLWAEINKNASFDLAAGLAGFIDQPGIPLVTVSKGDDGVFEFSQRRLVTGATAMNQTWTIPVTYKYLDDGGIKTGELMLDEQRKSVQLAGNVAWILPNADQQGYYRWNVPVEMLTRLGDDAANHLNVRERMGMLTNLWALLSTDQIDGDDFLAAIQGISSDTDPSVLSALLDQLGNVRQTFIAPELRDDFATYVQRVLKPTLTRVGDTNIPGEPAELEALRPQVLLWLADYGMDAEARAVTTAYTQQFLNGDIPPSNIVDVAMRTEARLGDEALFETIRERYEAAKTPGDRRRYVQAIGSFRDPEVVNRVLDYVLSEPMQPNEISTILRRLANWPDNNSLLLDWLMQHDAELRERLPDGTMARIPDLVTVCSPEALPTLREFYAAPERAVPGIESELEDSEAEVMECWNLRQREMASVTQYLGSL